MRTVAFLCIAASGLSLAGGTASADTMPGPPVVARTFDLGAGPMPDVASDPATHRAYITSQGYDSLYVVDAASRLSAITVGPSPRPGSRSRTRGPASSVSTSFLVRAGSAWPPPSWARLPRRRRRAATPRCTCRSNAPTTTMMRRRTTPRSVAPRNVPGFPPRSSLRLPSCSLPSYGCHLADATIQWQCCLL